MTAAAAVRGLIPLLQDEGAEYQHDERLSSRNSSGDSAGKPLGRQEQEGEEGADVERAEHEGLPPTTTRGAVVG